MNKIQTSKMLVVLAKEQHEALKAYAVTKGKTLSEVIRDMVAETLGVQSPVNEGRENLLGVQYQAWKRDNGKHESFEWWLVNVRYKT